MTKEVQIKEKTKQVFGVSNLNSLSKKEMNSIMQGLTENGINRTIKRYTKENIWNLIQYSNFIEKFHKLFKDYLQNQTESQKAIHETTMIVLSSIKDQIKNAETREEKDKLTKEMLIFAREERDIIKKIVEDNQGILKRILWVGAIAAIWVWGFMLLPKLLWLNTKDKD